MSISEQNSNGNVRPHIDYTNKDYASLRDAMLALGREKLPNWTDQSDNDPGVVLLELFAYMGDIVLYYQDRLANESYLDTAVERRSVMNMLRLIGCELRPSRPASADLTLLFGSNAKGIVTIERDTEFKATTKTSQAPIRFRYVLQPLTIDLETLTKFDYEGTSYRRLNLPVMQVDELISTTLGSSNGGSSQRFLVSNQPIIDESLEIRINGEFWTRQQTLVYSHSRSLHFLLRRDENDSTWIEFGDNKFGRIPPTGQNNILATFRVGGGIIGNVPPKSITQFSTPIGSDETTPIKVLNLGAASGGADPENIASGVARGPQLFRARSRAVTAEDYEAFAREFGIGKVRAQAPVWNTVELFVAPAGGGLASDTLKESLRLYFEDKRMLTSIVKISDPTYVPVTIEGDLHIGRTYLIDEIRQRVEDAVSQLLAFDNVDFADRLYISKFYEVIEAIEGVNGVNITKFIRDGQDATVLPSSGILDFSAHEIPQALRIKMNGIAQGGRRGR